MNQTTVSFPGLGIEAFTMDRVAFEVFGRPVYWYGVIIMLGMVAAFIHAYLRCRQEGIKGDDILDVGIWTILVGVIGARAYYVLTSLDQYDSFKDALDISGGGLAIYGGVIGGALAIVVVTLIKKLNTFKVMDTIGPGVMLAQAMGRWGNFVNGEAFGYEVPADHFLYRFRMGIISDYTSTGTEMHYYHPTFLYESVWNIVGFILISCLYRKKRFNGQMALAYLTWYGFGRMFIEGLRTDSLYVGPFRISQVIGFVCFVAGATLLVVGEILVRKGKFDKWLKVQWAQPTPAEGMAESHDNTPAEDANTVLDSKGNETGEAAEAAEAAETTEDATPDAKPDGDTETSPETDIKEE